MDFLSYLGDEFEIIREWAFIRFFEIWGRIWYPDSWVNEPRWGYFIAVFVVGILSVLGIIFATKRGKVWLPLGLSIVLVWTLPLLILWTIELTVALVVFIVSLAIGILVLWLAFKFIFEILDNIDWEHSAEDGDSGDEYYTKKEGGKEVVYKKGLIDSKVGDLHTNWDGSKETNSVFGPSIKVDKSDVFSTERKGKVEGQEGVWDKGFGDKYPTFKPDKRK